MCAALNKDSYLDIFGCHVYDVRVLPSEVWGVYSLNQQRETWDDWEGCIQDNARVLRDSDSLDPPVNAHG